MQPRELATTMMRAFLATALATVALATSCSKEGAEAVTQEESVHTDRFDAWLGQWNGPEGTFLALLKNGEHYDIQIKDLDSTKTYRGAAAKDRIEFERDGKRESLRATDGKATGMKWLADKTECLTIKSGEGFCRK